MFGWNESLATGIPVIDSQHQQLFALIDDLQKAMRERRGNEVIGSTLDTLVKYTVRHFSAEEALLQSKNYNNLAQHKNIHAQFTSRIKKFQDDHKSGSLLLKVELMDFLQKWLAEHIRGNDFQYVQELKLKSPQLVEV